MFQRILVANRGEIALRVIRACKDMGIEVVAVYSEADHDAPYLALADQAICIGPANSAESYLTSPELSALLKSLMFKPFIPAMVSSPKMLTSLKFADRAKLNSSALPMKPCAN